MEYVAGEPLNRKLGREKKLPLAAALQLAEEIAEEAPISMQAFVEDEFRERFLEICEIEDERRLVTSIES